MKKIFSILTLALVIMLQSCDKDSPTDTTLSSYVGFEMDKALDLPKDATVVVPIKVYASEASSIARTYTLAVNETVSTLDPQFYTMPTSVTIPANEVEATIEVSVTATNLGDGKVLKIEFPQQEGLNQATSYTTADGVNTVVSRGFTLRITEECLFNRAKLTLTFDSYPEETAWELYNSSNVVIDSGGLNAAGTAIVGYPGASTFAKNMCLPSGSYTFVIYDAYGDGMFTSASVQGNYKIELVGGATLVTGGGNFGANSVHTFVIP